MQKKFLPTIIFGLGGSGTKAIRHLRTICEEHPEYKDLIDKVFIFSALDTDIEDLRSSGIPEEFLIQTSENVHVGKYIEDKQKEIDEDFFSWWPADTGMLNTKPLDKGAGQIRITSRLGYHYQIENNNLKDRIAAVLNKVQGITEHVHTNNAMIRIYVISSLAGGTGSGIFTMFGYLIRELLRDRKISLRSILMLPELFCQLPQDYSLYNRIRANGYSALKELEAGISFADSNREHIDYIPEFNYLADKNFHANINEKAARYLSERPYDWCVLFDKVRDNGIPMRDAGPGYINYYKAVAHCLYMQIFSPVSSSAGSAEDNYINSLLKAVGKGEKSRRYSSFGYSALIFPKKDIANRLAYEYINEIITGYWMQADEKYIKAMAEFEQKKSEGDVSAEEPSKEKMFVKTVNGTFREFYPDPFKGIYNRVNGITIEKGAEEFNEPEILKYIIQIMEKTRELWKSKLYGTTPFDSKKTVYENYPDMNKKMDDINYNAKQLLKEIPELLKEMILSDNDKIELSLSQHLIEKEASHFKNIFEIRYFLSKLSLALKHIIKAIGDSYQESSVSEIDNLIKEHNEINNSVIKKIFRKKGHSQQIYEAYRRFFALDNTLYVSENQGINFYPDVFLKPEEFESIELIDCFTDDQSGYYFMKSLQKAFEALDKAISGKREQGLLKMIFSLFDNIGSLKSGFEGRIISLKVVGEYEDKLYPDNSKLFVLNSETAIAKFKNELRLGDSTAIFSGIYNKMGETLFNNWTTILEKEDEFKKKALNKKERDERVKEFIASKSRQFVDSIKDEMHQSTFKYILRSPVLKYSLGQALDEETRLLKIFEADDAMEYKKDKIKTTYMLSTPFIKLSKGDNRVNRISYVVYSNAVKNELYKDYISEYVKAEGIFNADSEDLYALEEGNDCRILFYQAYLAYDLGQVENILTGNSSLKSAYFREIKESAITPHIHKQWHKELEDIDKFFNEEVMAYFLIWNSIESISKVTKEINGNRQKLKGIEDIISLEFINNDLFCEALKLEKVNFKELFKVFRVNYLDPDMPSSKAKIEDAIKEELRNKQGIPGTPVTQKLTGSFLKFEFWMNEFGRYLDNQLEKSKESVFIQRIYNSVIHTIQRMEDNVYDSELKGIIERNQIDIFKWPSR